MPCNYSFDKKCPVLKKKNDCCENNHEKWGSGREPSPIPNLQYP